MRAAVLGHPIAHSLSPVLHRAAYAALGLDWAYDAVDVTTDQLPAFVRDLDDSWAGLSLTMPLKQAVIPLLDHVEPLAEVVGVVNTVVVQRGGARPTLVGANTDVHGIAAALNEGGPERQRPGAGPAATRHAVVLGAGATAASALAGLAELGIVTSTVLARSIARAGAIMRAAHRMGVDATVRTMAPLNTATLSPAPEVTLPAKPPDQVIDAHLAGPVNGYTWPINGKLYDPPHDGVVVQPDQRVRIRYINESMMFHPFHLHGHTFQVMDGDTPKAR